MFELFNKFDPYEVEKSLKNRNKYLRFLIFLIGITLSALSFNLFLLPNNFVSSGLTGITVIFSYFFEFSPIKFILVANVILSIASILTLGIEKSLKNIAGAFAYTFLVYLTADFASIINFHFDNILLYVIAAGVIGGLGESLVFKMGYSAGGISTFALILNKYLKKPLGQIIRSVGYIVIGIGGLTFGYTAIMYSLLIVYISTLMIDKITLGISNTKMFLVVTKKEKLVKKYVIEIGNCGVTELESRGAYSKDKQNVLMFVVPTEKYFSIKLAIKEIDEHAFIIVSDCYEVLGGTKRKKIPCSSDDK